MYYRHHNLTKFTTFRCFLAGKIASDRKNRDTESVLLRELRRTGSHNAAKRKASAVETAEEATATAESSSRDQVAIEPKWMKTHSSCVQSQQDAAAVSGEFW